MEANRIINSKRGIGISTVALLFRGFAYSHYNFGGAVVYAYYFDSRLVLYLEYCADSIHKSGLTESREELIYWNRKPKSQLNRVSERYSDVAIRMTINNKMDGVVEVEVFVAATYSSVKRTLCIFV